MSSAKLEAFANRLWYEESRLYLLFVPLSWLFGIVAWIRRTCYARGLLRSYRLPVPVVIVGNITVGGSGKTPVTLFVAESLKRAGMTPAIISRGYGGTESDEPRKVTVDSNPAEVGDEPVVLAFRSGCAVYVDSDRVRAAEAAVLDGATVIISDDGLQHYRLQRDAEIAVVDGARGLGNGHLLPAGPLREPESRLLQVDRVLVQRESSDSTVRYGNRQRDVNSTQFWLAGSVVHNVQDGSTLPVTEFDGREVHAIAGIANPERFFRYLESLGMIVHRHPFPDHSAFTMADTKFDDDLDVIMTEKDAVKCRLFAHERLWCMPVELTHDESQSMRWVKMLHSRFSHAVEEKKS